MTSRALDQMRRTAALLALAVTAASCGTRQPAPDTRQWIIIGEDGGDRASLDAASIRGDVAAVRAVTYAVDHVQVQESDGTRYDREELEVEFDCARYTMRIRGGIAYLHGVLAWAMDEGPQEAEWEDVPPGTLVAAAMKHVCRMEP
jgi:hypothetical protein